MYKVCMKLLPKDKTSSVITVMECNRQLDEIYLIRDTKENIKFYAHELLPEGSKFEAKVDVYLNNKKVSHRHYSCFLFGMCWVRPVVSIAQ